MDTDLRYCQSCGMPLDINKKEYLGSNVDNSCNTEFCFSCFQNGKYTVDDTLEHLLELWIENTDWYNNYSNTHYTPDELRIILKKRLPKLKRWKQKNRTKNIHNEIINRAIIYINQHLFDNLDIDSLSQLANLSKFYFLRTFKNITGENAGSYIQRLRLEHIAHLLLTTNLSLSGIIRQINYQSKHSLSKAFSKHFGISPSEYKERHKAESLVPSTKELNFQIKQLKDIRAICLPLDSKCNSLKCYQANWESLIRHVGEQGLRNSHNKFLSISLDDSLITGTTKSRFVLGMTVYEKVKAKGKFHLIEIPNGKYAMFQFIGDYSLLHKLYRDIHLKWLPQSEYRKKSTLSFEVYINTPLDADSSELVTEVYIPIEKKMRNGKIRE